MIAATSDHASLLDTIPNGLFIAGRWQPAEQGRTLDVFDPATGGRLAAVADASPADGLRALDAAVGAGPSWAATSPRERSNVLRRAFDLLVARTDDVALTITLEMGKPIAEARSEVGYGAEFLRWFSEEAVRVSGRYGTNPAGTGQMLVTRHPLGPCYLVTPWNFPLAMATRKIAPALAAGCTVVLKPSELTPLTSLLLVTLLEEAGVPPGVVNVVTTSRAADLSAPLLGDPRLRKLSFTGSTAVGRILLAQAAAGVMRTSMELGGNAPFLVFDDADLDAAVDGAMAAKFRNMGQACTSANRFIVHESVADEFVLRVEARVAALRTGSGTDSSTDIGPLINDRAVAEVDTLVRDAVNRGARLVIGGNPVDGPGHFYPPTVLDRVAEGSDILRKEIFGPVLAVIRFSTEDEACALANDTEYGLVGYAFTRDLARGNRLIERLETGMFGLNIGVISDAAAPFGGIKQSGIGREGGAEGIDEYLTIKYTLTPHSAAC